MRQQSMSRLLMKDTKKAEEMLHNYIQSYTSDTSSSIDKITIITILDSIPSSRFVDGYIYFHPDYVENNRVDIYFWIIEYLATKKRALNKCVFNYQDLSTYTPLMLVTTIMLYTKYENTCKKLVEMIVNTKPNLNILNGIYDYETGNAIYKPNSNISILHLVVEFYHYTGSYNWLLKYLLENGANAGIKDGSGKDVLMSFIYYRRDSYTGNMTNVVDLLITYGGDPTLCDNKGNIIPFYMSYNMGQGICAWLLDRLTSLGMDVNKQNNNGQTALLFHVEKYLRDSRSRDYDIIFELAKKSNIFLREYDEKKEWVCNQCQHSNKVPKEIIMKCSTCGFTYYRKSVVDIIFEYGNAKINKAYKLLKSIGIINNVKNKIRFLNDMSKDTGFQLYIQARQKNIMCPISHQIIEEPYKTSIGTVYNQTSIRNWLKNHNTDPMRNTRIDKIITFDIDTFKKIYYFVDETLKKLVQKVQQKSQRQEERLMRLQQAPRLEKLQHSLMQKQQKLSRMI